MVRTVISDIDEKNLGLTYVHDHLIVRKAEYNSLPARILLDDVVKTLEEVRRFKKFGGQTIVDVQPFGAGRDIEALKYISEESGVKIVASTGVHKLDFYRENFWSLKAEVDEITEVFIDEIVNGAYAFDEKDPFKKRTNIKAGIIKIATDNNGLTDYYQKIFKAAAKAHRQTGVSIITHTELSTFGTEQAAFLIDNGVEPDSIIISHMDKRLNIENIIKLAKIGVFLEFDCIARYKYHSDNEEILLIKRMVEEGFVDRIVMGMDSTRERFLSYGGNCGLTYIIEKFIPKMNMLGIKDKEIKKILIYNPESALRIRRIGSEL